MLAVSGAGTKRKKKKKEKIIGSKLYFLDRWGPLGILLKNDIRLIIRNIRYNFPPVRYSDYVSRYSGGFIDDTKG